MYLRNYGGEELAGLVEPITRVTIASQIVAQIVHSCINLDLILVLRYLNPMSKIPPPQPIITPHPHVTSRKPTNLQLADTS